MTTKDEVRSTVEALRTERALRLALEALEETRNALAWFYDSYPQDVTKKGNELLPHVETVLTTIREALASQSEALADQCVCGEPDTPGTHRTDGPCLARQSAEIPQSITCPFCESQHVPGWLHDYNMDRMKKPAPATEFREQQSAERVEPVAVYVGETWCGSVVRLYEDLPLETPLYTSPQPRGEATLSQRSVKPWVHATTWRGLTDDEANEIVGAFDYRYDVARAVEAKLREKNEHREKNA